jgi:RNA polymerase sigma-70 factor (ECF subfamily)
VTRDPDLAADAVQEAFATALERLDSFRGDAKLGTWLHRIVYTKAIDLLRRRGRELPLPEEEAPALGPQDGALGRAPAWARPPDQMLFDAETQEALERAAETLSPVQRAVFALRILEGRSAADVGQILDLPVGTVRVYLHRARMRLRDLLSAHFRGSPA